MLQPFLLASGGIIAAFQVVASIKRFLPYRKLQANVMGLISAFSHLIDR